MGSRQYDMTLPLHEDDVQKSALSRCQKCGARCPSHWLFCPECESFQGKPALEQTIRESPPGPPELPQWRFWLRSPVMPRLWGWNAVWVACGLILALLLAQNLYRRHPLPVKTATDPKPPQSAIPAARPGDKSAFNSKAIIQSDPRNGQTTATDGPAIVQRLDVRPNVDGLTIQIVCNVPVTPQVARLTDPPRLVIDLPNTRLAEGHSRMAVHSGFVTEVRASQFRDTPAVTRIVVELTDLRHYHVVAVGNNVAIITG